MSSELFVGRLHNHADVKTEKNIESAWPGRYPMIVIQGDTEPASVEQQRDPC